MFSTRYLWITSTNSCPQIAALESPVLLKATPSVRISAQFFSQRCPRTKSCTAQFATSALTLVGGCVALQTCQPSFGARWNWCLELNGRCAKSIACEYTHTSSLCRTRAALTSVPSAQAPSINSRASRTAGEALPLYVRPDCGSL